MVLAPELPFHPAPVRPKAGGPWVSPGLFDATARNGRPADNLLPTLRSPPVRVWLFGCPVPVRPSNCLAIPGRLRRARPKKNPPLATGPSLGRKRQHSKSIPGSVMCRNSHTKSETFRAARREASWAKSIAWNKSHRAALVFRRAPQPSPRGSRRSKGGLGSPLSRGRHGRPSRETHPAIRRNHFPGVTKRA